jgi:hypothetical protein
VVRLAGAAGLPFQIHTGIQAGSNYVPNSNPTQLSNLFTLYRDVRFDLFHSSYPYLSECVVLAKMYANVYVDMCWTHIISPSAAKRALHEYLDALARSARYSHWQAHLFRECRGVVPGEEELIAISFNAEAQRRGEKRIPDLSVLCVSAPLR